MKLKLAAVGLSFLAGAALFAFAHGYMTGQYRRLVNDTAERAYAAGRTAAVAEQAAAVEAARNAAEAAAEARIDAAQAERDAAVTAADEAERGRMAAVNQLRSSNADFAACYAAPYPDAVRAFPRRVRGE